jgi:Protein of unknown function (DUF1566).
MNNWLNRYTVLVIGALLLASGGAQAKDKKDREPGCPKGKFPASGQEVSFPADKFDGISGPVAVPDDGEVEAGAELRYRDNGDGTITDLNTRLMWEKKDFGGDAAADFSNPHDVHNTYVWSGSGIQVTIWDWLDTLNGFGFAGHDDWRIPNVKELQTIVDYGQFNPAVDPAFNNNCNIFSDVEDGSCTAASFYWSSTTNANFPGNAWFVDFFNGTVFNASKFDDLHVRAVRGGCL